MIDIEKRIYAIFFLNNNPTDPNTPEKTADANAAVTQAGMFEK